MCVAAALAESPWGKRCCRFPGRVLLLRALLIHETNPSSVAMVADSLVSISEPWRPSTRGERPKYPRYRRLLLLCGDLWHHSPFSVAAAAAQGFEKCPPPATKPCSFARGGDSRRPRRRRRPPHCNSEPGPFAEMAAIRQNGSGRERGERETLTPDRQSSFVLLQTSPHVGYVLQRYPCFSPIIPKSCTKSCYVVGAGDKN